MNAAPEQDPRIYFAAERTFLAWLRTGLALMGFGFVVARVGLLFPPAAADGVGASGSARALGITLIVVGVLATAGSFAEHVATVRRLQRGEPFVGRPTWLGGALAALLAGIGVLMTLYLIASG
jgi:putative membrane protein